MIGSHLMKEVFLRDECQRERCEKKFMLFILLINVHLKTHSFFSFLIFLIASSSNSSSGFPLSSNAIKLEGSTSGIRFNRLFEINLDEEKKTII